ncbi:MAG: hypothetical protein GX975_03240 [Clostridiales bacterium]|nr:hypothetical protein [Clostridiales bacterium]
MNGETETPERMEWEISVSIFKNPVILKQLGIAIGIPFGIVALVVLYASGKSFDAPNRFSFSAAIMSVYTLYALGLIAALLFLTWLLMMLLYRGKYDAEFVLDDKAVLCRTQAGQAKKNRIINALVVVLGIFSRKPAAAGAGLLAQSRQETSLKWKRVTKVKYRPKSNTILIWGGLTEQIALFCTPENYSAVERMVAEKTRHLQDNR